MQAYLAWSVSEGEQDEILLVFWMNTTEHRIETVCMTYLVLWWIERYLRIVLIGMNASKFDH